MPPGPPDAPLTAPAGAAEGVLTGERTWPGIPAENYWFARHLACYRWAATQLATTTAVSSHGSRQRAFIDAGAGEGYGCELLRTTTDAHVVAFDLDETTMRHLRHAYQNIIGVLGNLIALPFQDRAFAAAVSLQVVEHIWDPIGYLSELDRCTAGPVIISTPNRPVHSPGLAPGETPRNPFHVREFDAAELRALLARSSNTRSIALWGLHHGDRIQRWEHRNGSLAEALIKADRSALDFAETVTDQDFTISPSDGNDSTAQDLIALW